MLFLLCEPSWHQRQVCVRVRGEREEQSKSIAVREAALSFMLLRCVPDPHTQKGVRGISLQGLSSVGPRGAQAGAARAFQWEKI